MNLQIPLSKSNCPNTSNGKGRLLDHALEYAAIGLSMIPTIGKRAACKWKPYQKQRPGPETVMKLFDRPNITGLAVVLGSASGGLACRDFDIQTAYDKWATDHSDLAPRLPTVATHRGRHVYFRTSGASSIQKLDDGELRGDGGYCLLPPSRHPSGSVYRWLIPFSDDEIPLLDPFPAGLSNRPDGADTLTHQLKQHIACVPKAAMDAIEATLPDGPGQRNRRVFDLARRLKGIVGLDTSPAMLKTIAHEWHGQALPIITTKHFDETWSDFQIAWQRVKVPHGASVRVAYQVAHRAPEAPIDDNAELGVLAALCRQLGTGDRTFYLSCRTVEDLFGVRRMRAWRWLQVLQFYGVIECVKAGTLKNHQATIWRYNGKRGLS